MNRVQTLRLATTGAIPPTNTRDPGELWLNFADLQLGLIDALKVPQKLLAVRFFSANAGYAANDIVVYGGAIWVAITTVAPGGFDTSQWTQLGGTGGGGGGGAFLPIAGGTMTGSLLLAHDPSVPLEAATKHYIDTLIGTGSGGSGGPFLPLAGGTMTGAIVLPSNPTLNLQAATKQYVDSAVAGGGGGGGPFLPLAGGTMTGPIVLAADPVSASQAANKHYVDAAVSGGSGVAGNCPTGAMLDFAGVSAPAGWVLCDGTAYLSTDPTYAPLYAVIGLAFGSAPGGYFKVPDLRNRATVGAGSTYTLGNTGGAATVTLSVAQLASHTHAAGGHTHTVYQDPHSHNINPGTVGAGDCVTSTPSTPGFAAASGGAGAVLLSSLLSTMTTDTKTPTVYAQTGYETINNTGGGASHENMPPYFAATKIIKL